MYLSERVCFERFNLGVERGVGRLEFYLGGFWKRFLHDQLYVRGLGLGELEDGDDRVEVGRDICDIVGLDLH